MLVIPPSDVSCVTVIWLTNVGYTVELVPLVVKVAAINKLMIAARRMRRVHLKRKKLYGAVIILCALVTSYLVSWTIMDPPRKDADYR